MPTLRGSGKAKLWILNLDDLLAQGCDWLDMYLATHPEDEEMHQICAEYQ
ncbi:MAG: hypothetical protein F6J87_14135 [Spirulina sp. SIO3F2]|nr:hypothetical protein [Spirulina sp. SIO3F2]